jgi:hypothetical protein
MDYKLCAMMRIPSHSILKVKIKLVFRHTGLFFIYFSPFSPFLNSLCSFTPLAFPLRAVALIWWSAYLLSSLYERWIDWFTEVRHSLLLRVWQVGMVYPQPQEGAATTMPRLSSNSMRSTTHSNTPTPPPQQEPYGITRKVPTVLLVVSPTYKRGERNTRCLELIKHIVYF